MSNTKISWLRITKVVDNLKEHWKVSKLTIVLSLEIKVFKFLCRKPEVHWLYRILHESSSLKKAIKYWLLFDNSMDFMYKE